MFIRQKMLDMSISAQLCRLNEVHLNLYIRHEYLHNTNVNLCMFLFECVLYRRRMMQGKYQWKHLAARLNKVNSRLSVLRSIGTITRDVAVGGTSGSDVYRCVIAYPADSGSPTPLGNPNPFICALQ